MRRGEGLRDLHARPWRTPYDLERWRRAHSRLREEEILGRHFSSFYRTKMWSGPPSGGTARGGQRGSSPEEGMRVGGRLEVLG